MPGIKLVVYPELIDWLSWDDLYLYLGYTMNIMIQSISHTSDNFYQNLLIVFYELSKYCTSVIKDNKENICSGWLFSDLWNRKTRDKN